MQTISDDIRQTRFSVTMYDPYNKQKYLQLNQCTFTHEA